ncbi:MAG: hypothetical protein ABSH16_13620, partial [Sedimentisphaerales bacterium]
MAQAKTNAAGSQIPNHPAGQAQPAHPVANTPLVEPQSAVAPSPKVVMPPLASVTPSQEVVMPPPASVVPPSGDHYTKSVVSAKPAPQTQRPFTIPEPPNSKTPAPKSPAYEPPKAHSPVYEPPAHKQQGVYEPPPAPSVQSSAKHQKVEIISPVPGWQTSVLKILR